MNIIRKLRVRKLDLCRVRKVTKIQLYYNIGHACNLGLFTFISTSVGIRGGVASKYTYLLHVTYLSITVC